MQPYISYNLRHKIYHMLWSVDRVMTVVYDLYFVAHTVSLPYDRLRTIYIHMMTVSCLLAIYQ